MNLLGIFWNLVIESAPWLLIGYLLAGIIKQVIPSSWVEKQLAEPGFTSIVKGAFIGAPLPLCSCGVIPTALAIRKAGASKGATASFLVATPETGVDSISFSYAVLGPVFALARPIAALISAIIAGVLVHSFDEKVSSAEAVVASGGHCCGGKQQKTEAVLSFGERLVAAIRYGYGQMIADTAKWLVIGLVAATVITAAVPQSFFLQWGNGVVAMVVMVIVGLPMYICATASTPVAASLLFAGISPGAALVFMLTGPATNIATMGVIKEQLGLRSLLAYLAGVIGTAIACGLLLNEFHRFFGWPLQIMMAEHGEVYPLWRQFAAILLACLVASVWLQPLLTRSQQSSTATGQGSSTAVEQGSGTTAEQG